MSIEQSVIDRSNGACELCGGTHPEHIFTIQPDKEVEMSNSVYVCTACHNALSLKEAFDASHWKFIEHSVWSEHPAVQIIAFRVLNALKEEAWASEALDMMYLEDDIRTKAEMFEYSGDQVLARHRDSNGAELFDNDTVVLIKTLDVKGSSVSARLGTVIKNIRLDKNDTNYIEGKIEGQSIMILTQYLKKQGS